MACLDGFCNLGEREPEHFGDDDILPCDRDTSTFSLALNQDKYRLSEAALPVHAALDFDRCQEYSCIPTEYLPVVIRGLAEPFIILRHYPEASAQSHSSRHPLPRRQRSKLDLVGGLTGSLGGLVRICISVDSFQLEDCTSVETFALINLTSHP